MRNKINLLRSRNKPNLRDRNSKQNLQSRSRRDRRSSNSKLSHRSKSNKRRAKKRTSRNIHSNRLGARNKSSSTRSNKPKTSNGNTRINVSNRSRLSRTKKGVSNTNSSKPMAMRKNHRASTHGMVRKIGTDTNTTKVVLAVTIMPALRKMVGATTRDVGNTLTAAIGSMQEHIRCGFTSGTCTSSWERMGYGMPWRTMTLL